MRRVRNLANWCNLSTPLGLAVAKAGGATLSRGHGGLWLAENYRLPFPIAGAFTVGSVVIAVGRRWDDLEQRGPGTLAHEENHTWQWAWMMGLPFLPAYTACMAWSWLRTGDRASANFFERDADLLLGGYREAPRRPWSATFADVTRRRSPRGVSGRAARAERPTGRRGACRADGEDASPAGRRGPSRRGRRAGR